MNRLITLILCLVLIAGQGFYLSVSANPDSGSTKILLAMAQPMAVGIPISTTVAKKRNGLYERSNCSTEKRSPFIEGVRIYAHNFENDENNWLASNGVIIGSDSGNNYINLKRGNILLSPENDIVVGTSQGSIYLESGATVFITQNGGDVVVYDLLQTKPSQVSVMIGKYKLIMKPGAMLVLTEHNIRDFQRLARHGHSVAYNNVQLLNLDFEDNRVKAFVASFSIVSALVTIQPLKRLTVSADKEDQLVVERLVRGAVLLGHLRVPARTKKALAFSQQ